MKLELAVCLTFLFQSTYAFSDKSPWPVQMENTVHGSIESKALKSFYFSDRIWSPLFNLRCNNFLTNRKNLLDCCSIVSYMFPALNFAPPKVFRNSEKFKKYSVDSILVRLGAAAFAEEFEDFFESKEAYDYFLHLVEEIEKAKMSGADFDLFSSTMKYVNNDIEFAIKNIVMLFQDTKEGGVHLNYLANVGLSQAARDIDGFIGQLLKYRKHVKFYPKGIPENLDNLYHFYVPSYFAMRIRKLSSSK